MQSFIRVHVEFVVTGGYIYQTKTVDFQNIRLNQQSSIEEKEMEMKGTSTYPKPLMKGLTMRKIC